MRARLRPLVLLVVLASLGVASGSGGESVTLVAAGDIASCSSRGDEATARLVARLPGTVAALGDTVYERGTAAEYATCYTPSWGRFKARTRPAVGNHEYLTEGAAGYFRYFGRAAGPPRGFYSYDLGAWHVVVLNSNCGPAGGCEAGSLQERWLRADLASHPTPCTLAYAHHARFSSGLHGSDRTLSDLWRALVDNGVELFLSGHDHHYERFAPRAGLRQFVVGTGGRSVYPVLRRASGSQVVVADSFGVLALTLQPEGYRWGFLSTAGSRRDAGAGRCR